MIKSALAILLAIAALSCAALWIGSYLTACSGHWQVTETLSMACDASSGHAECTVWHPKEDPPQWDYYCGNSIPFLPLEWHMFAVYSLAGPEYQSSGIIFPLWAAFLVTVWFPILVLSRSPLRRRHRRKRGLCLS